MSVQIFRHSRYEYLTNIITIIGLWCVHDLVTATKHPHNHLLPKTSKNISRFVTTYNSAALKVIIKTQGILYHEFQDWPPYLSLCCYCFLQKGQIAQRFSSQSYSNYSCTNLKFSGIQWCFSPKRYKIARQAKKKDHWLPGHLKPETFIFCVKWKTESHAWVTTKESFEVCGQLPTIILAPRI